MFNFKQFLVSQNMTKADYVQFLFVMFTIGYLVAAVCKFLA